MSDYCDEDKARRDAEWLAGSELDNAERNLARAFLQLRLEVKGFDAMWEAREQDELPAETPMTEEEMEAMAEYFAKFCTCGHHEAAHVGGKLCGSPHGCGCVKFTAEGSV